MNSFYSFIIVICFTVIVSSFSSVANAQFTTLTNETRVNTTTSGDQIGYWWTVRTLSIQLDGGYIVVWIDTDGLDGSAEGIFGQRFNASGAKVGVEFQVNTTSTGDQFSPAIAVAPDGSFVVAWEGPGNSIDVWAKRFTKEGVKVANEFLLNTTIPVSHRPTTSFRSQLLFVPVRQKFRYPVDGVIGDNA